MTPPPLSVTPPPLSVAPLLLSVSGSVLHVVSPLVMSDAVQRIGDVVTGRVSEAKDNPVIPYDDADGAGQFQFLSDVLRWRAQTQPDNQLFTLLDNRVNSRIEIYI